MVGKKVVMFVEYIKRVEGADRMKGDAIKGDVEKKKKDESWS